MIRHIVMWDVRGETADEKRQAAEEIKRRFEALLGVIPGLLTLDIGLDTSRVSYACDVVLFSEFTDQAALDAYADHPAHLAVRDALKDMRIARHQVDYAVS